MQYIMAACNMVAYRLEENGRKLEVSHFAVENPISLETSKKKSKWLWSWGKIWAKLGPML